MASKIPKEIIEELKLKDQGELSEAGKIIVEKHQVSIRLPKTIKAELDLKEGSYKCEIKLQGKKTIIVDIK
jgi:hypothetical protein